MKTVPVDEVQAHFSAYLEQARTEGPIVITQNGEAVAVLLSPQGQDDLERLVLGRSAGFQALLEQSRQSIRDGKGLSRDAFWEAVARRYGDTEETDQE